MKAAEEIRSIIQFQQMNLNDSAYPVKGPFDLIFCRNVLIYLGGEVKVRVIAQLLDHLSPHGFLFLGHAETLNGLTDRVQSVVPTIYAPIRKR